MLPLREHAGGLQAAFMRHLARTGFVLVVLAGACPPASGPPPLSAQTADTTRAEVEPLFTGRDAIYAGAFTLGTLAIAPLDRAFADYLQGAPQESRFLRRLSTTVERVTYPGTLLLGGSLYVIGRLADNERLAALGLHGTEAIVIGFAATGVIKVVAGRARPYLGRDDPYNFAFMRGLRAEAYRSFPSGHTLVAFAAATVVVEETRRWWPGSLWYIAPLAYGGATMAGVARMYSNNHWASDVVMGAALGAFSGHKVAKYHRTRPDNRLDRWLLGISIGPRPDGRRVARLLIVPVAGR